MRISNLQMRRQMRVYYMVRDGEDISGREKARKLPNPAICRARYAKWPGMVFCLVRDPDDCKHVRFFNQVAYCTHPKRENIISKTAALETSQTDGSD